jgi:ribonuclease H / adenosylcobalamin/alpha-ribazole phosphatase
MLILYADGASRGNPGPASLGAVLYQDHQEITRISKPLGITTNNFAEYSAVIAGLEYVVAHGLGPQLLVRMDSKLVVEQLSGRWQIKHPELRELAKKAFLLMTSLTVSFEWIPREQNYEADALANLALDEPAHIPTGELSKVQPRSIRAPRQHFEPTVIVAVRHGHTASTEGGLISGSKDNPPLSELGLKEAKLTALEIAKLLERFELASPSLVVHSDQLRAAQTAESIAGELRLNAEPDSRLREISFGDWERVSMAELEQSSSAAVDSWRGSLTARPPAGESVADLENRVNQTVRELISENVGKTVVLVAHMMPMRSIARLAMGADSSAHWSIQFQPGSISVYRFFGTDFAEVFTINSCQHLP